jgi:hypothetical protein
VGTQSVITCPECNRQNDENAKICAFCGAALTKEAVATRSLDDTDFEEGRPQWGTARFNQRMRLILHERDSKDQHVFYFDEIEELVLGRLDPDTGEAPDVDLSVYEASDKGVSRRHASIVRLEHHLKVVDKDSPNGTFLNGQRLVANQARILRDGDELRLGHLVLRINFDRV